ncbi:structural maintenance of chromosomes protein-like protein 5 [Melanomma pulvis-pyrius CBS 109.77]|uniref:Structural maintenance of chromosomes protein 5 n=1 Tax=Melanomma pulvis-pyrius CBS 109.77 TaxID=1314802 RepID=A0A6A6XKE6_9PLEO|nr:structural maintenance of chromosomes protein-like protein 5 [Melanomma pulvis-pyrius CBS 109.77]
MPGVQTVHKRRNNHVVSSDAGEDSGSDMSSKRARLNSDASSEDGYYDGNESIADAHQPGSIVRVKLTEFVTYTAAEFHPGPSLNMVIGPNGTGKSTLVCAICLGLGWSPKHLGRAKEIGEFVKHGSEKAEIEIELAAGKNHNKNPVIHRAIRKEGNKSLFYINGIQSTQAAVVELARSFSIQIDNLCQFLPQDRVVEFARLDPVSLLRETQRAAAPEQMIIWHDKLKKLRTAEKLLEVQHTNEDGHLKDLQKKQNATREDVEHWNQRQDLVLKSKALVRCRPVIKRAVLKNQLGLVKAELRSSRQELQQLQAEEEPTRQAQRDMVAYRDQIDQIVRNRRNNIDRAKRTADNIAESIKTEQGSVEVALTKKDAEKDTRKKRQQQVDTLNQDIKNLERSRESEPERLDERRNVRYGELRSESSRIERRELDVDDKMSAEKHRANELKRSIANKKGDREQLDTRTGQQAILLARLSSDAAAGWKWIEDHRASLPLKGHIHGPPILTCSVTDPRMADAVESQLKLFDMTAITCENAEDAQFISNKLLGDLSLHQVSIRTSPQPLAFYRSPATRDELSSYGLEGWLVDYLQGPEPVLAMLCENAQIHRAAFTSKSLSNQEHQDLERSTIATWIAGQERYQITRRREYGATSTRVTNIKKARMFIDQPVDGEEKRRLDNAVTEMERDLEEVRNGFQVLRDEKQGLKAEHERVKAEMKEIQEYQEKRRKAISVWKALPGKIAERKTERDELVRLITTTSRRVREMIEIAEKGSLEIARKTLEYTKAVAQLRHFNESLVEAEIRLVEANSEFDALENENRHILQRVAAKEASIRELEVRRIKIRDEHNDIVNQANADLRNSSEEEKRIFEKYQNHTSDEDLENEIEAVTARLSLMAEGNPHAVRAYEKREQDIAMANEKLLQMHADLNTTKERILQIRGQWEPQLDTLVAKISDGFSNNFEKIGCAGQVGVYKDDDFENWSIQIQVRFRENESLSILDSHRQSGGERAVSTIFYLMALQDLARSPFRVVDEINQGMDPRNERMVHERMVDIACRERTSQYFLITPKLLNNLKFHPKMKIHCIASGEHMPDQDQELNFQKLAEMAVRMKRQQIAL